MEEQKKDVLILAIETSCDETAAAVVKNGRKFYQIRFTHRLNCIRCLVVLCRKLHQENI